MRRRTRPCDDAVTDGRPRKAEQFWEAAICCVGLGEHAAGDDHAEALALIATVRPGATELAKALAVLLGMKTRAGYGGARSAPSIASAHNASLSGCSKRPEIARSPLTAQIPDGRRQPCRRVLKYVPKSRISSRLRAPLAAGVYWF